MSSSKYEDLTKYALKEIRGRGVDGDQQTLDKFKCLALLTVRDSERASKFLNCGVAQTVRDGL
jgi:hypothetical protein